MDAIEKPLNRMTPAYLEGKNLGKYRLLEPLGRGGMAQVYKAYHPQLDRYVAIKVLRSDLVEDPEFLARFQREARAVASLSHAHIVHIFDFDVQDDLYYMVMELLEGDTLKAQLNAMRVKGETLPLEDVVRIFLDALDGLSYAHSEGIIHRDIKPANLMLTRRGQGVLTDFGIAQILGGTQYTVSGALMGTLSYMAPEQGLEGHCDIRSDIYSLGVTLFEALTGRVPFDADTPLAVLMKHINDPLPLPRTLNPAIPESFERVVMKALAKHADDRYQSAAAMQEALTSAASEAGVQIPETITLPQAGQAQDPLVENVAVFSGRGREQISDLSFASGDTNITTGRHPGKTSAGTKNTADQNSTGSPVPEKKASRAVLTSVVVIIFANMIMLWLSGIVGWELFSATWPMELVLVSVLLLAIMASLPSPWLLIPGGILMGNGLLLEYFALTGKWSDWTLLWPLEPILIATCIVVPFVLDRKGQVNVHLTRRLAIILLILCGIAFIVSLGLGIVNT